MKILHICLSSHYTEGMTYQDNMLVEHNVNDGHQVLCISDCNKFENGIVVSTLPENVILKSGAQLIRPKFMYNINSGKLMGVILMTLRQLTAYIELKKIIDNYMPDVILCHHPHTYTILNMIHYKKRHNSVKIYFDYHVDSNNTSHFNNMFDSIFFLRNIIYRNILRFSYPHINKIFYIWGGSREYIIKKYHTPKNMIEFYPLGGAIPSKENYVRYRAERREELDIKENDILLLHTGKLDSKKQTRDIISAFLSVPNERLKLVIIGSITNDMKPILEPLIESDKRILYLGWKSGNVLLQYLCAGDLYVQLGGASATMQNALCCGCPVLLNPLKGYYNDFMRGNGKFVNNSDELINALNEILENQSLLESMKDNTWKIATEILDYNKLAARLYI